MPNIERRGERAFGTELLVLGEGHGYEFDLLARWSLFIDLKLEAVFVEHFKIFHHNVLLNGCELNVQRTARKKVIWMRREERAEVRTQGVAAC